MRAKNLLNFFPVISTSSHEGEKIRTPEGIKPLAPKANPFDRFGTPSLEK